LIDNIHKINELNKLIIKTYFLSCIYFKIKIFYIII
jgi:hypothetical protein